VKNKINKELLLQLTILLTCLLAVMIIQSETFVKAQTNCSLGPPFYGETSGGGVTNDAIMISWAENSEVIVKIDDEWNEDERKQIADGIKLWNGTVSTQTCSNVTFKDFGSQTFPDKNAYPPFSGPKTIYVMKAPHSTADIQSITRGSERIVVA
jgi:hypothetical protein